MTDPNLHVDDECRLWARDRLLVALGDVRLPDQVTGNGTPWRCHYCRPHPHTPQDASDGLR